MKGCLFLPCLFHSKLGGNNFHTRTPMYFGINAHEVLKQKILRQATYCCLIWEFFRPLFFLLWWRQGTFHMYYVNGEKKHSTAGTPILATRFGRVCFTVYMPALKTQGPILTKDIFSQLNVNTKIIFLSQNGPSKSHQLIV